MARPAVVLARQPGARAIRVLSLLLPPQGRGSIAPGTWRGLDVELGRDPLLVRMAPKGLSHQNCGDTRDYRPLWSA